MNEDDIHLNSALYIGETWHHRYSPKVHSFKYHIMMFWLDLDEVQLLDKQLRFFSEGRFNWVQFRRSDYLSKNQNSLKQEALETMSALAGKNLTGKIFLLSPLRILGMYFSPVNFYYLQDTDGNFTYMLAEVSNTPWNERHCYLVDLAQQNATDKAFHVSPFNPIDMQYQWQIATPGQLLKLQLDCIKEHKHFSAAITLKRSPLNNRTMGKTLFKFPHITIKTLWGIYWQALKLLLKRIPIYDHPDRI